MSLFGSLYTGAAGMNAQTKSTSLISENIANMTTTGYKRSHAAFHDLVNTNKSTLSQAGSVSTERVNRITAQGGIQQTSSGLDVAVSGNGFFVVRENPDDPVSPDLYTRNGSFTNDASGYLRNSAGYTLFGWAIDENGVVDTGALVPVDIDILATTSRPTSFAEMVLNLNAGEVPYDPHQASPAQTLPVTNQSAHFSRALTVYDGNGTGRQMTFEFRKVLGPMAHFSSNTALVMERDDVLVDPGGATPGILAGDTLSIDDGTNTLTINFVSGTADPTLFEAGTLREAMNLINNYTDVGGNRLYTATLSSTGNLTVQANDPTVTIDLSASSASVLGATGFNFVPDPADADYIYAPEASLTANGAANPNQTDLPAIADVTTPNPYGWWEMTVTTIDPADPNGTTSVEISRGLLNFNGDGSLNATADANGDYIMDFPAVNFDNTDATDDIAMTLDMTRFTQFTGNYTVGYVDQNGAPVGTLVDSEITRDGDVLAVFSNGIKLEVYRIPLATFTNADGLTRIDGTAFAESEDSGAVSLFDPGEGGAGVLQSSSLENSNVDVAEEFSGLIVSQRAYSLNGQIINAVDEMTQTLSQLKR